MSAAKALKDAVSALAQMFLCSIIMDINGHNAFGFILSTGVHGRNRGTG